MSVKFLKVDTRKVLLEIQFEKIDTAKKLGKSMISEIHPQNIIKNVFSFLSREYFSLKNMHQLSQLKLPTLYIFFPLDIRNYY